MPIPNIFHIIRYALYFVSHTYCDCQLHDVCLPLNWFSPETPPSLLYSACAVLSFSRSFTIGVTDAAAPPPTGEEKIGRMRERRTGRVFSLLTRAWFFWRRLTRACVRICSRLSATQSGVGILWQAGAGGSFAPSCWRWMRPSGGLAKEERVGRTDGTVAGSPPPTSPTTSNAMPASIRSRATSSRHLYLLSFPP